MTNLINDTHPPDEELLLYTHGLVPLWRRLRIAGHLPHCAACQARTAQFRSVSQITAGTLGDPMARQPWAPAPPPGPWFARLAALLSTWSGRLLLLFLVALIVGGVTLSVAHQRTGGVTARATPSSDKPCRPDIPSDLCR